MNLRSATGPLGPLIKKKVQKMKSKLRERKKAIAKKIEPNVFIEEEEYDEEESNSYLSLSLQSISLDDSTLEEKGEKAEKGEEYAVERILGKKKFGGTNKYLVKWKGYSSKDATWEPTENLHNCKEFLDEFESSTRNVKKASKPSTGHFKYGDIPQKIIRVSPKENTVQFTIKWEKRDDNFQPKNTIFKSEELRTYDANLIINYYEETNYGIIRRTKESDENYF